MTFAASRTIATASTTTTATVTRRSGTGVGAGVDLCSLPDIHHQIPNTVYNITIFLQLRMIVKTSVGVVGASVGLAVVVVVALNLLVSIVIGLQDERIVIVSAFFSICFITLAAFPSK